MHPLLSGWSERIDAGRFWGKGCSKRGRRRRHSSSGGCSDGIDSRSHGRVRVHNCAIEIATQATGFGKGHNLGSETTVTRTLKLLPIWEERYTGRVRHYATILQIKS
jgi:hypothetical protein